jgi:galactonate dehydratase
MKITSIEPIVIHVTERGDWVFVLIHTDVGITGLGEASHSLNDALLIATLRVFAEKLVGANPLAIRQIWRRPAGVRGGRITHTAVSAIDQALWDILGRHLGAPLHVLFGGAVRERLRLYANINRHVRDRSPEGFALAASQAVAQGFTAIKLAPFDEVRTPDHVRTGPNAAWRQGVARVRAVREAIGDAPDLAIDCHSRMEASEAIVVGKELENCNLLWYEEPVKHTFHVACTIPNYLILEYAWGEVDWRSDLVTPQEPVQDGYLMLSDAPGLGYRLNDAVVAAHRRDVPGTEDSTKVYI